TDIWVIDNVSVNVNGASKIDARIAQEVRSIEGVAGSYGIVLTSAPAIFEGSSKSSPINIVGSDGPLFIAGPNAAKIIEGDLNALSQSGAVSAEYYNAKSIGVDLRLNQTLELNRKAAVVKVLTKNVQGFGGYYMF